jgi:hypothetical protein
LIEEKRKLNKPFAYNNLAGLGDLLFWIYKNNLDVAEEASMERRRIIGLLERIAEDMDGVPRLVVVVHEEKSVEEPGLEVAVEPMVVEELDSGLLSRVRRMLNL